MIDRQGLCFEVFVTVVLWLPTIAPDGPYFPLLALLRVIRLFTVLKNAGQVLHDLQIILAAFSSSIVGLGYVICLVGIFFFYFAVAGTILFKHSAPYSFGSVFLR